MMILAFLLVTFADVQPILQKHCAGCHQAGEIAPMPFLTYQQVRPWAKAIAGAAASSAKAPSPRPAAVSSRRRVQTRSSHSVTVLIGPAPQVRRG